MHLSRSSSKVPRLPSFLDILQNPHVLLTFGKMLNPLRLPHKPHLNLQKWSEHVVFNAFWFGNVLRATTACTFSTCQLPKLSDTEVLCTFWLRNLLPATRRALFRHLNFQECSDTEVFCTHWLRNVLRATTVCTFSTSQLPKVLEHGALYVFTSKCASRHNGVHFLILHLARWLRTRRFSEPTFRPSGATNHWKKHGVSRLFYLFPHLHLLSSDSFSSLIFALLLFSSLTLHTSAFPSLHIVRSLTSILPLVNNCRFEILKRNLF